MVPTTVVILIFIVVGDYLAAALTLSGGRFLASAIELGFLFADPFYELLDFFVFKQSLNGIVMFCHFALGENRVKFTVAYLVNSDSFLALEGLGDKMMLIDRFTGNHLSLAYGTNHTHFNLNPIASVLRKK